MKILIAGATGAIGRPLIDGLKRSRHTVFALTRPQHSQSSLREKGVEPIVADALDRASIETAIARVRPDAVINELTSLPKHYTPAEMQTATERDRKVRVEGNRNLLSAMGRAGVRRYVLQSAGFWYAPGVGVADESAPLALDATPGVAAGARIYAELEATAARATDIECVILRYGFFYGPGTWYTSEGDLGEQARARELAIIGDGQGVYSFVHIEDAAAATAACLESAPGIYNVVDDNPSPQRIWLSAFARAVGAPEPPHVAEDEAMATIGADAVYYATRLRGASNEKAKRVLHFGPRPLEWLSRSN